MEFPGFQAVCEAAAERWDVPALAAGVSLDGRRETVAAGCSTDTRFRVASVTKPFTAALALKLVDFDASTAVWPEDVHVRHLLSHTSGYDCECGDLARFGDGDDALGAAVRELPSVRRLVGVDQVWSYSNAGYWLAGWLCANAAGTTYEDALAEHVLGELPATSFDEPDLGGTGPQAIAEPYPRARRPSGGLVSNVADLLTFAARQLGDRATDVLRLPVAKPTAGVYGYGFDGERVGGFEVWGHPGSYGGFQSSLLLVPSRRAAFVGLTNSGRGKQALREVEDAWFDALLGARRRVPDTLELSAEALREFEGVYANTEFRVSVAADTGHLIADVADDSGFEATVRARPIGPRTFEIVEGDFERDRFDYPVPGFARFGSRLTERVA
ncbi:MAG TPA: serine hydrolase domain-containing protein [Gaiellaceae bacterium]